MGILRKLGLRDRKKNARIKPPETFSGVAVGCGPGKVTLPPSMNSSSTSADAPYRELASSSMESTCSSEEMMAIQAQKLRLPRVSEESSVTPDSPLSIGPAPSKTPPDLSPASSPRQYNNDFANRTPVIRGQKIAERTALFENSPVKNELSLGKAAAPARSLAALRVDLDADESEQGSSEKRVSTLEESDSMSSGSVERDTSAIKRGDVVRKKKWLEQAFTPTGGGNMSQSTDEEDENRTPKSTGSEYPFDVSPPPASPASAAETAPPNLSASKRASSASIFRFQSPDDVALTERQPPSPLVRCGPMDEAQAYRIWHAKGLLAFQPDKPRLWHKTVPEIGTPAQETASPPAGDPNGSYHHSDSITMASAAGDLELAERNAPTGSVLTSNGKLIVLETISDEDDDIADLAVSGQLSASFAIVNPFDEIVDRSSVALPLEGTALLLSFAASKQASVARSNSAPVMTFFGGKVAWLYKPAGKVPTKRVQSSRRILISPASPHSAASKSHKESLVRSTEALRHSELALTLFGGEMSGQEPKNSPNSTKLDEPYSTCASNEILVERSANAGPCASPVMAPEETFADEPLLPVVECLSAIASKEESQGSTPPSLLVACPISSSRRSIDFSKQRSKDAIGNDGLVLSAFGGDVSRNVDPTMIKSIVTEQNAILSPSKRVEAYQNYVQAFKSYKKDRKSVENSERTKAALALTKSPELALPQPRKPQVSGPIILSLFSGATMNLQPKLEGSSTLVRVYENHVHALKRRSAKMRQSRSKDE